MGVEHPAAAHRVRRGDLAHHEAVSGHGDQRAFETDLPEGPTEPSQPRRGLAGSVMNVHAAARLGLAAAGGEAQLGIEQKGLLELGPGRREQIAPGHLLVG